jgi:hypothetical protein
VCREKFVVAAVVVMSRRNNVGTEDTSSYDKGGTATRPLRGVDPKELDVLLSDELAKLSVHDREVLQEQLHGISSGIISSEQETPEVLEGALNLMAYEVDFFIKPQHKRSYLEAITKYPDTTYVCQNDFRLRFLRCEQYDVKGAANRMVRYLDLVNDVFGSELLERPMRLSDVTTNAEEVELLRSGIFSLLPAKDRAGRRVFASVGNLSLTYSLKTRLKLSMYMFWIATEDVEAQLNGLVIVMWPGADAFSLSVADTSGGGSHLDSLDIQKDKDRVDRYFVQPGEQNIVDAVDDDDKSTVSAASLSVAKLHVTSAKMFAALPIRVVGHHCCGFPENPLFQLVKGVAVLALGKSRSSIRFHSGSATEIRYKLHSFGIPGDLVQMTDSGNIKNKNHLQWITIRRALENHSDFMPLPVKLPVEVPFCHDLLFRYGQPYLSQRGNIHFREIVAEKYDRHRVANNEEKIAITWEVVEEVERFGRFLTWDKSNNWWIEIDDKETKRSKAASAFKEHGRRSRQQANVQANESCSACLGPAWKKQKFDSGCDPC